MPAEGRVIEQFLYHWITIGGFNLDVTFRVDSLSTLFTLVITGVGTLIHFYSIGYMGHDETPGKFFAYLNLFCFAMLVLVLGGSLPLMFLGWEGVGLCSYLLIGYWYTDIEKAKAGKKAFIVNRIGDFGFLLGMFLIFTTFDTLDFRSSLTRWARRGFPRASRSERSRRSACFSFVGCMGKSAQIPLYVWFPDAMAGPTPVSALIHAATMVTSGIYLVSRLNFLYSLSPTALVRRGYDWRGYGVFCGDNRDRADGHQESSRLLDRFTAGIHVSRLRRGSLQAGVFHVITHAFFKALMFLAPAP